MAAGLISSVNENQESDQSPLVTLMLNGWACEIASCQTWSEEMIEMDPLTCVITEGVSMKSVGETIANVCQTPVPEKRECSDMEIRVFQESYTLLEEAVYDTTNSYQTVSQRCHQKGDALVFKLMTGQLCDYPYCRQMIENLLMTAPDCVENSDAKVLNNIHSIATIAGEHCGISNATIVSFSSFFYLSLVIACMS